MKKEERRIGLVLKGWRERGTTRTAEEEERRAKDSRWKAEEGFLRLLMPPLRGCTVGLVG